MKSRSAYSTLMFLVGLALAAGLAGIALKNLVDVGPFSWHIAQPRFKQGLIEILVLAAISAVASRYWRKYGLWFAVVTVAFYCRRQNIDYAIVLALIYSAGIVATGELAATALRLRSGESGMSLSRAMEIGVLGITFFSLAQWLLALTGIGFVATVAAGWVISSVAIASWFFLVYLPGRSTRAPRQIDRTVTGIRTDLFIAFALYLLIFLGLAALAKTNYKFDSDSLWYGLRPDSVLFHGGSLFSPINLSVQVYYYPKLYELLMTPLSKTGDNSSILAFGVVCWGGYVVACAALASLLTKDRRMVLAFALMAGSTPAMIGIAPTAKGDLLAAALAIAGLCKLIEFDRTRQLRYALLAAAGLMLAPLVRIAAIPYVAFAACWLMASYCIALWERKLAINPLRQEDRRLWIVVVAALAVFSIVTFRTYVLTGLPFITPVELQRPFLALGMTVHYPVANPVNWSAVPIPPLYGLLKDFLFRPAALPHVMLTWTGNVWLLLGVLAAVAALIPSWRPRLGREDYFPGLMLFAIGGLFFLVLATQHFGIPGGDGNYYIIPITALMAGILLLCRRSPYLLVAGLSIGSALVYCAIFMMATMLWWVGTTEFNWDLTRNPLDNRDFQQQKFSNAGMSEVEEATAACGADVAAVGALARPYAYLLPYRYEALTEVAWTPANVGTPQRFAEYLQRTGVDFLILPKQESGPTFMSPKFIGNKALYDRALEAVALASKTYPGTIALDTTNYRIWAFTDKARACIKPRRLGVASSPPQDGNVGRQGAKTTAQTSPTNQGKLWSESTGSCSDPGGPTILIHWSMADKTTQRVAIYVQVASGEEKLFAAGGRSGASTGKWIRAGNKFLMRDRSSDQLIALYTVEASPCSGRTAVIRK